MHTMQSFYATLFSPAGEDTLSSFLRVAQASLKQILAVRSELAWDVWTESQ